MRDMEKKNAYNAEYIRSRDNIMIRPSKEDGARIRAAAAQVGKSVQAFIIETMLEAINRKEA